MEDIELPRETAAALFDTYVDWFEDFDSGFLDGLYENGPDPDERIAYEFATGIRGEPDGLVVNLPWHAAVALEAGVSSHLEEEGGDPDVQEALAMLTRQIETYEAASTPTA